MGNHGPAQKRREKSEIQVSTGIRRLANFRLWAPVISANCVVGQKKTSEAPISPMVCAECSAITDNCIIASLAAIKL